MDEGAILTEMWDNRLMVIFPSGSSIAINWSSGESVTDAMSRECWMGGRSVCVEMSQNLTVRFVVETTNSPRPCTAKRELQLVSGMDHSETVVPFIFQTLSLGVTMRRL